MGRTTAEYLRFSVQSQLSSTKQQREITKICMVWEQKIRRQINQFSIWTSTLLAYFMLKLIMRSSAVKEVRHIQPFAKLYLKV